MRKCPGFDGPCDVVLTADTTWTVGGSQPIGAPFREEWSACEDCALAALRWTHAEVADCTGEVLVEEAS